jgi:predicted AAA+ superfamily ATPase
MAPQTPVTAPASNSSGLEKSILGCECAKDVDVEDNNNNNTQAVQPPQHVAFDTKDMKAPAAPNETNERNRNLVGNCLKHLSTNLNVLVIGSNSSGKTSLINSMNMAYHQEWKDRARYCPGRLHVIDECVVFRNRSRGSKVVFWDSRGFEDIHEDSHAVLILRYVLEGRIASKCIPCVLLMSKELL